MADYPALQVRVPSMSDAMQPIASMLAIRNTALQGQGMQLQLEQTRDKMQEAKIVQQILGDQKSGVYDADGTINLQNAQKTLANAGVKYLLGPSMLALQGLAKDQIAFKQGANTLNTDQRKLIASALGTAKSGPEAINALQVLSEQNPNIPASMMLPVVKHLSQMPQENAPKFLGGLARQLMTPTEQANYEAPQLTTDQFGNPMTFRRDLSGGTNVAYPGGTAPATPPAGAAPGAVAPNTPTPRPRIYGPGEAQALGEQTMTGGKRYTDLVNTAADSPTRVNVLDNILDLAPTAGTGYRSDFKAKVKSLLGTTVPGFSGATDDSTQYQMLTKFLEQGALRSWQAAGGTGTNAQLEAQHAANPNNQYNPQTIVDLARWNKAGELALQGKANALNGWLHQPNNGFANQAQFENDWRNNFDPRAFQLKTLPAAEAKAMLGKMNQQDKDALLAKIKWLKSAGAY